MSSIHYQGQTVQTLDGETVLDAFLRHGISIPFSCRDGACHSCKQIATSGNVPAAAQHGLSEKECQQGACLPCVCVPTEDLTLVPPREARLPAQTVLHGKTLLTPELCKLSLEPTLLSACVQGEWLKVTAPNGETRSFVLANQPAEDYFLEIHLPRVAEDAFSDWVFDRLELDAELEIQGTYPSDPCPPQNVRAKYPPPDPVLWDALKQGTLMLTILQDFYGRVYQDPLLAPYFHGTTMLRSIEKVYSFMRQVCTGENVFFGDRPKNAHHWMVISPEIYQHRENLMRDCQRRAGLPAEMTEHWMAIENYYRDDIVKSEPWKRVFAGVELPVEGFEELVLDEGYLCDGCGAEINAGETVRYHVRIGTVYCARCNGNSAT